MVLHPYGPSSLSREYLLLGKDCLIFGIMKPSLDDLSILVTIADTRSLTQSARLLEIPISTLSRRLIGLEKALRTSLFHRSTRAVSLTGEGQRIYDLAKPAIESARDAATKIGARDTAVSGQVIIATTAALGQYLVAPKLADLVQTFPDLKIDLRLSERRDNIIADGVDIAIRIGKLEDSDLISRRFCQVTLKIAAAPAYLTARGALKTREDLAKQSAIVTSPRLATWHFDDGTDVEMAWQIAAGNMITARDLAVSGLGIAMLPDFMIEADLRCSKLIELLPDTPVAQGDAWIVTSKQRYRATHVQAVIDRLLR
jgi:DNA-binding transcriptional LysR family regulator